MTRPTHKWRQTSRPSARLRARPPQEPKLRQIIADAMAFQPGDHVFWSDPLRHLCTEDESGSATVIGPAEDGRLALLFDDGEPGEAAPSELTRINEPSPSQSHQSQ